MRQTLKALLFAAFLLLPGAAYCQCTFTAPLPVNTVIGRLGVTPGPCQAIPFATLSSKLTSAIITLNSGNGQTAPGAMSGGNTFLFGATTDTPQFTGIGLGGTAPATGLEIFNAPIATTGNGQAVSGATSLNGGVYGGQGTTYDVALVNKSAAVALGVPTGTQNVVLQGTLTAASLSTVGTIAGSLCATSAGVVLYEAAVNCFAVSGITVVSGKTLTIDNTIELAGTDSTKFTFPSTTGTVDTLEANQTVSGNKTFSGTLNITGTGQINGTAFGTFATQNFATPPAIGGTTPAAGSFSTLTVTTPCPVTSGCTGQGTVAGALSSVGLGVEALTNHGDSNYSILSTDHTVATSGTFTTSRTWTLPTAASVNPDRRLIIQDFKGFVSATNTLIIVRNGSDTINGGTGSQTINNANGGFLFISDGVSNWSAQALGAQAAAGVASINGQTGNPSIVSGTAISVSTSGGNISVANTGVTSLNGQTSALTVPLHPQGRLTLQTATPVMTSTQSAKTTIFYTAYQGNQIPIYDGTNMISTTITGNEISVLTTDTTKSPAAIGASKVNDWFVWNDGGTIRISHGPDWTNDTTPSAGTALVNVNGFLLNSVTITNGPAASRGTYVGTTRSNGSSQLDYIFGAAASGGTAAFFGVWNMYNRVSTSTQVIDSGAAYTYTSSTVRQARGSAGNQASFVLGRTEDGVSSLYASRISLTGASNAQGSIGIGLDTTTGYSSPSGFVNAPNAVAYSSTPNTSLISGVAQGYHVISANEGGDATNANSFDFSSNATLSFSMRN